jgi:hypothetical protein
MSEAARPSPEPAQRRDIGANRAGRAAARTIEEILPTLLDVNNRHRGTPPPLLLAPS